MTLKADENWTVKKAIETYIQKLNEGVINEETFALLISLIPANAK